MSNFSNIITDDFKLIYKQAIQELVENCSISARLFFGNVFESCDNCITDSIGNKSNSVLSPGGGPLPFHQIDCPVCDGTGKRTKESTENINLAVIWDFRDWIIRSNIARPEGMIQTISLIDPTLPKIKRAKELIVGTDIEDYARHRFKRNAEPEPVGLGRNDFIITIWERL